VVHRQVDGHQTTNVAYTQGLLGLELIRNFAEIREATRVGILQENVLVEKLGWLTVISQGIRASGLNPADTLRHE
jgi:hypothetical protein